MVQNILAHCITRNNKQLIEDPINLTGKSCWRREATVCCFVKGRKDHRVRRLLLGRCVKSIST